jgi:hypothetical protein
VNIEVAPQAKASKGPFRDCWRPEDKLRVLIPYMDLNEQGGFVTFRRVPEDKRELIEQLRATGILGRMNILTDKGKAWLNAA